MARPTQHRGVGEPGFVPDALRLRRVEAPQPERVVVHGQRAGGDGDLAHAARDAHLVELPLEIPVGQSLDGTAEIGAGMDIGAYEYMG